MPRNEPIYSVHLTETQRQLVIDCLLADFDKHQFAIKHGQSTQKRLSRKHADAVWDIINAVKFGSQPLAVERPAPNVFDEMHKQLNEMAVAAGGLGHGLVEFYAKVLAEWKHFNEALEQPGT